MVPTLTVVTPGEDTVLECAVDANPFETGMISWSRQGFNFNSSRISVKNGNGSSILMIHNVTREDVGEFVCRARNNLGETNVTAGLLVERK